MSYFGSRYLAIESAAPRDTFVLERGAAECSSLPVLHLENCKLLKVQINNWLNILKLKYKLYNWVFTVMVLYGTLISIWSINLSAEY